jgi:hypothetical protein
VHDGFDFTVSDVTGWYRTVGFRQSEMLSLGGSPSAGIASQGAALSAPTLS